MAWIRFISSQTAGTSGRPGGNDGSANSRAACDSSTCGERSTHSHAARASVELTVRRPGQRELTLTGGRGAYEFGTSDGMRGIVPQPLPEG